MCGPGESRSSRDPWKTKVESRTNNEVQGLGGSNSIQSGQVCSQSQGICVGVSTFCRERQEEEGAMGKRGPRAPFLPHESLQHMHGIDGTIALAGTGHANDNLWGTSTNF